MRQRLELERPGALAAYAVDADVADVSAHDGHVSIYGRSAGSTLVTLVTADSTETLELLVEAPIHRFSALGRGASREWTSWETLYNTESALLTNALDLSLASGGRSLRLHAVNVTQAGQRTEGFSRTSFPSAALELAIPGHRLVLFDELVDHSPLTLQGTSVRGIHYGGEALELHAGYTTAANYQDVFLPSDREAVLGASYRFTNGGTTIMPNLYAFLSGSNTGGTRGVMGSVVYGYGRKSDPLRVRGELGWGGKLGASLELAYDGVANRVSVEARHQPEGFASVGVGRPHGSFVDGVWDSRLSSRVRLSVTGSFNRYQLPFFRQQSSFASTELRYFLGGRWSATAGASGSTFDPGGAGASVRSLTIPLGLSYDAATFGASALYRYQRNSLTNDGGSGGRLTVRGSTRHLYASLFADGQRDVPTLDLIFRDEPDLARVFAELGITVHTPDEVARALRENPILVQLGYIEGVTVNLDPSRLQLGGDVAWRSGDAAERQLRLHVVVDRTQTIRGLRQTSFATVSYSQRLWDTLAVVGSYTRWKSQAGSGTANGSSVQLSVRMSFDGVPRIPGLGRRTIGGFVLRDDEASGRITKSQPPVAGAEVRVDGGEQAVTDARGHFAFRGLPPGQHRVEVVLPRDGSAYFTTPSVVTVEPGREALFGLAYAPARLLGTVKSDAGVGIAGVTVRMAGGSAENVTTTDSSGAYSFTVAEGDYVVTLDRASFPTGYDVTGAVPRPVSLTRAEPTRLETVAKANRSIAGRVLGPGVAGAVVRLVELDRSVAAAADGSFVFRGLPPGTYTLRAEVGSRQAERSIRVPEGPSVLRGADIPLAPESR